MIAATSSREHSVEAAGVIYAVGASQYVLEQRVPMTVPLLQWVKSMILGEESPADGEESDFTVKSFGGTV